MFPYMSDLPPWQNPVVAQNRYARPNIRNRHLPLRLEDDIGACHDLDLISARSIGPNTEGLVISVLANRPHPEQGFRTCLGILRLFRGLDPARAEAVSARAVAIGALTCKRSLPSSPTTSIAPRGNPRARQ